jgi:hypothetical protein
MNDRLSPSRIESLTASAANRLATRSSRRSFIGLLSRVSLFAVTTPTILGLLADDASANLGCDCLGRPGDSGCTGSRLCSCGECGHSVSCRGYTGSGCPSTGGTGGVCPPNTHACGVWTCPCPGCPGNLKTWTDCCTTAGQCVNPSSATCVCDTDGVTRATCTYKHFYAGGQAGCNFIVCRHTNC